CDAPFEVLVEVSKCRLGALSLGDVAGDLRGADDAPRGVADGGYGHRNVDVAPVLASPHRLEMVNPLAPPKPGQNLVLFVQSVSGKEHGYRPADHLLRPIAEDGFGAPVPARDDPVQILADNGVVGRV